MGRSARLCIATPMRSTQLGRSWAGENYAVPYGVARQEPPSSLHNFSDCGRPQECRSRSISTKLRGRILDSHQRLFLHGQGILDVSSLPESALVASSNSSGLPQLEPRALNKIAAEISRSFAPTLLRCSRPPTSARGGYCLRAGRPISPSARPRQPVIRCLSRHLVGLDFLYHALSGCLSC